MSKFRAVIVVRIAIPLNGVAEGREEAEKAEAQLASTIRASRTDKVLIARAQAVHEKAEAKHLRSRSGLAKEAEKEATAAIRKVIEKTGEVLDVTVEVVEEVL